GSPELHAQIYDRYDRASQVHQSPNTRRHIGDLRKAVKLNDPEYASYGNSVLFTGDMETEEDHLLGFRRGPICPRLRTCESHDHPPPLVEACHFRKLSLASMNFADKSSG